MKTLMVRYKTLPEHAETNARLVHAVFDELRARAPEGIRYATYRLAQCQDAARVALEMGNSPQMLFRNYRELADEKEAAAWFSLIPPAAAANVVPIRRTASEPRR